MHLDSLDLPAVSFFGRGFTEYLLFLGLRPADLHGRRVLDCAAGPAAFTAEAVARGIDAVAVDPLYRRSEAALRLVAQTAFARMFEQMHRRPELFAAATFPSLAAAAHDRRAAVEQFLNDYYVGVALGRYRCGALPALPFADHAFDLGLCAHLLFVYDHLLDLEFHVAAIRELCRVSPAEVRIHPVVDRSGSTSQFLPPVREALAAEGIQSDLLDVDYAFFRGATRTLVFRKA